jgi:imidazolonepropionase-like amidohydrolase
MRQKVMHRVALLLLIIVSQVTRAGDDESVVAFVGVNVVRPEVDRVDADQTVLVTGNLISAVGPADSLSPPAGALLIAAEGAFLLPGLAEMHAHVPLKAEGEARLTEVLFLWVANGVTTVRGMRGEPSHLVLKERIAHGEVLGPRLFTAGPPFMGTTAKTPAQTREMALLQIDAGYDFLKVHMGLGRAEYDVIVVEATRADLPFAGHVAEDVGLYHALESGQASIDHLDAYMPALVKDGTDLTDIDYGLMGAPLTPYVDPAKFDSVAAVTAGAGVWNAPTLSMVESFMGPVDEAGARESMQYMPQRTVKGWMAAARGFQKMSVTDPESAQQFLAYRKQLVKALHDAGAGLLLASDSPQILNVPGFSVHRELQLLIEAGLTPAQALTTGTANPAVYLGQTSVFGKVTPGLEADLLLVAGNPLDGLATLREPLGVMVRGRWLSGEQIREDLAAIAANHAQR